MSIFLLVLIMMAVPLVGGVLLIVFSRRGPAHPACGKCGYNVHGSIGSVIRCPECGADFGQAGITPPRGKRNPLMIAAGVALIVLTVGCFSSSLLFQRATIAQAQAQRNAAAQKAAVLAAAAQPETEEDPEED